MTSSKDIGQIFNTFYHLLRDLEPFVDVQEMRLTFDKEGQTFLVAPDFSEPIQADPKIHRLVREELHQIIARHRSIQAE
jgi:hypothetical protein